LKSVSNTFEVIVKQETITEAIRLSSLGKRDRSDVLEVFGTYDRCVTDIQSMLLNGTFKPTNHPLCYIKDGATKKTRQIIKPSFYPEQIVHHCLIWALSPSFQDTAYYYSLGSMPDKGGHLGAKYIKKWIRNDEENTKYVFKCDIHHFFESIDKDILYDKLNKRFGKDRRTMDLIKTIIYSNPYQGLPLGYYTSQWFANFYLESLDYYIKQELKAKYYKDGIVKYITEKLHLVLKDNWQIFRLSYYDEVEQKWKGRNLDFLGYRFFRNKTILRKHIMLKASKTARRIGKVGPNCYNASVMISYIGWINDTDSYNFFQKHIKPYVQLNRLRKIVSKDGKRRSARAKFRMEIRERNLEFQAKNSGFNYESHISISTQKYC
jgi:hypothetical protein